MQDTTFGIPLVDGTGEGEILHADIGLSFWGGVDAATGTVIDRHHPLVGSDIAGRVLAIPSGRGSCSGSGVLLELILTGRAPAAVVVCEAEEIITLGSLVGEVMFARSIPVLRIDPDDFARLAACRFARVSGSRLMLSDDGSFSAPSPGDRPASAATARVRLDPVDEALLAGDHGPAAQVAMRLVLRMAELAGATALTDVTQVHIDGCIYAGSASLLFAERLLSMGGRVRVPTTLNAISVDHRRWRAQGIDPALGEPASALADAYVAMGARPTFTCAPYLLESAPGPGEQIGWAESNAVVYANSLIGARTMKYPDFLDACIALTGRAPLAGCHLDAGRRATVTLAVDVPKGADDVLWPLLGYVCGATCGTEIPLIVGLDGLGADVDDWKAFGAAFATVAAAPMFHVAGVTPEAAGQQPAEVRRIGQDEMRRAFAELNTAQDGRIDLVSLGNPHFSLAECARLAALVRGRSRSPDVAFVVTCGRAVYDAASEAGYVAAAEAFGATFVTDTCWCMLGEPVIPPSARTIMTNSGKYAHYAPGLVGRAVRFAGLEACVDAACTGLAPSGLPAWLRP
jgi:predicted aconitase/predicted aconitase with swiveling domain